MDNYYTSVPLVDDPKKKGLTVIGTLKANKREIPPQFFSKSREVDSCLYEFQYDKLLASIQTK